MPFVMLRPYYTMHCFTGIFFFPSFFIFPYVFSGVFDTNMLVTKTQEKRKKKARKLPNARKTCENVSILHCMLGKNTRQLRFSHIFAPIFAHKPY